MKNHSMVVLLVFLCVFLVMGMYKLGAMDRAAYIRQPIKNLIEKINKYGNEYLSELKTGSTKFQNPKLKIANPVTTLGKLIQNRIFNTSQETPKPEVIYVYNKLKSPLSVQSFKDLPYIDDDISTEKDIPKDFPLLNKEKSYSSKKPLKKILMWNDFFGSPHFEFGFGQEPFLLAKCPVNSCITFNDRNKYPYTDWDAVIWHIRSNDKSLPKQRSNHTRYVFLLMESPVHIFANLEVYNGIFNWTMVYRMDSDIYLPYGLVFKRRTITPQGPYIDYAATKTKMAAWFVSNCHSGSGREKLTEKLQMHIQVDVFGNCGRFRCERKYQFSHCLQMLEKDYKFYLAFENSLCRDYVTEKFFNILSYNVIPVVYGFGNYSLKAPPHSYIDVLDYPNVTSLADYLIYLNKNHTAYNEYFEWKRYYKNLATGVAARSWCKLCEKLHTDDSPKEYTNLYKWFVTDSHCKNTNSRLISDFING